MQSVLNKKRYFEFLGIFLCYKIKKAKLFDIPNIWVLIQRLKNKKYTLRTEKEAVILMTCLIHLKRLSTTQKPTLTIHEVNNIIYFLLH
jgi:hypothetical protein